MSPEPGRPTLKISDVEKWKPDVLGSCATQFDKVVTKGDQLLQSMLTTQDDLAESWKGAGADAAASRVTSEKTAGSHLMEKIAGLKTAFTTQQTELAHAKQFVIDKRNLIVGMGFEVADDGTVTAEAKRKAIQAAAGNSQQEPANVTMATLQVGYEAQQQHVAMLGALQHAENTAVGAKAAIDIANQALNHVAMYELPPKQIRAMFPGLTHPDTARPGELPPVLGGALQLEQGIPITVTNADGSTTTTAPNPDGTLTVSTSVQQPDGSTVMTETTGNQPPVTTVTTKPDGAGITSVTVTAADGKSQQFQKVPEGNGKTSTYAVNADGSRGTKVSESYPQNGGTTTDRFGPGGVIERQWQRPDGFRAFEQYVPGPDGQPKLAGTANSAGMRSVMNPDGTITTTDAQGKTAQTAQLADGRIVTKFPDGSVLQYDPNQAPAGAPKQTIWDNTKLWAGTEWNSLYGSSKDTVIQHPLATGFAGMTAGSAPFAEAAGNSLAAQAQAAMADSQASQARALQLLDSGTPGAGHAFVGAMDSATDAASKAQLSQLLKSDGKMIGGVPLGAAVNIYTNYDDWSHGKPLDEAAANAAGGTAGGWAGGLAGAEAGAWACSAAGPIGSAFCAGAGAALGGFFGGSFGAWAAEQPFK
ncbi:RHS repeat protein [Nocardia elegans]|uniref:RHS repeat protein n=1 Tax=Nocardia elegans TaxID=300029 RepID=A0ABW6TE86_9NOCA|nr:RHS repeat protein [Nocardia elegans]MBF6446592.1 RHS repeat protein [Nocardia elegans]